MIHVRLYAAPLADGTALVAPPGVLRELHDVGHLLARASVPVGLDVLVPYPLPPEELSAQAITLLRRAVCAAAAGSHPATAGPRHRWYAALVLWGWLTVLFADQLPANVLGGLWLGVGLPWARHRVRQGAADLARRGAAGWATALWPESASQAEHYGLVRLAETLRETPGSAQEKYRAAAAQCASLGVPSLTSLYDALASGALPTGIWSSLQARVQTAPNGAAAGDDTPEERIESASKIESPVEAAEQSASAGAAGVSERTFSTQS